MIRRALVATAVSAAVLVPSATAGAPQALPVRIAQLGSAATGDGRALVSVTRLDERRVRVVAILVGARAGKHTLSLVGSSNGGASLGLTVSATARTDGATLVLRKTARLAVPLGRTTACKWSLSELDSSQSGLGVRKQEVTIETLELAHAGHVIAPRTARTGPNGLAVLWRDRAAERVVAAFGGLAPVTRHGLGFYSLPEVGDEVLVSAARGVTSDATGAAVLRGALTPNGGAEGDVDALALASRSGGLVLHAGWRYENGGATADRTWRRAA